MNRQRLNLWFDGKLPDEELTAEEVAWLEEEVFAAIERRLAELRPGDVVTSEALH